jgi:hypothetical protein
VRQLLLVVFLFATPASAHEWFDSDCCSDRDCRVVPSGTITELPDGSGWRVRGFSEKIGRSDPRARPSKNGQEAVCSASLTLRCIYYRPNAM